MNLMQKPNRWSCIATAFAMVLDIPVDEFFRHLGHDGSDIVDPELPEPVRRRGVHIQEAISVAMLFGRRVTPIELFPQSQLPNGRTFPILYHGSVVSNWERFTTPIFNTQGVITGQGRRGGHAVAFDHGDIFDPDKPERYPYARSHCELRGFHTQCLWIVT